MNNLEAKDIPQCRHFNRGYCAYGDQCKFAHHTPTRDKFLTQVKDHQKQLKRRRRNGNRAAQLAAFLAAELPHLDWSTGPTVLDVAGGKGDLAFELSLRGCHVTVVDPREVNVDRARARFVRHLRSRRRRQDARGDEDDVGLRTGGFSEMMRTRWKGKTPEQVLEAAPAITSVQAEFPLDGDVGKVREVLGDDATFDLVVGLHPDQPTEGLVRYALATSTPFAVLPCCVCPRLFPQRRTEAGEAVRSYEQLCVYLQALDDRIQVKELGITGRNKVLYTV